VCGAHITINATSSLLHLDRSLLQIRCIPLLFVIHLTNHSPNQSEDEILGLSITNPNDAGSLEMNTASSSK
jgi:hypothetical protein